MRVSPSQFPSGFPTSTRRHGPQEEVLAVLAGGRVRRPASHPKLMGDDPCARPELAPQLGLEPRVDTLVQPHRHDGRRRNVGGEEVALDERRAIGDLAFTRDLTRDLYEMWIDCDADRAPA